MSIVQVRHIKAYLHSTFSALIDMNDWSGKPSAQVEGAFLSRSVAALALMSVAGIPATIAAKSVVDGGNDNGIDAVYYDQAERLLYLAQSKWDGNGQGSVDRAETQKFIVGVRDIVHPRFDKFNDKVRSKESEINSALDDARTRCVLIMAYTGSHRISAVVQGDMDALLHELNDTSEVFSFLPMSQKELHTAITSQGESIDLEVMIYEWAKTTEPFVAFYGQVKADDVAIWWSKHGVRLLSQNLRGFLGPSEVNEAITATLLTHPERFWYFNNGITALCADMTKKIAGGADRSSGIFECKGVSIVNGAQTVGAIAQAFSKNAVQVEKARVLVRFISLKDCPPDFASDVTRATNTQNRIELRDFASLDPEQERLRIDLQLEQKKTYLYKTGVETVAPEDGCTIDEAAVALACAQPDVGLAVQAKREVSKLYEDIGKAPYKLLFNPTLNASRMWRVVQVHRMVEGLLKVTQQHCDGRERLVAIHGNRFILHRVLKGLSGQPFEDPAFDLASVGSGVTTKTLESLRLLKDGIQKLYPDSYLSSLFKNADKCRKLSTHMDSPSEDAQMVLLQT
jgi:hypothetical protein